ncbi:MAG: cofactor-independent phosphoglycerate mutase [Planctomycetes bacterium]|nr:cofactor-independent phosphoglycerate mutase [Planctomycetota bacterium]
MKYAIVIPDGAADYPQDQLGGRTPLAAASTVSMDWLASNGLFGTAQTVPKGMYCGSDVAILSVLGYDPREFYTGRAPIEAAAKDIKIGPDEWVFRCNLVTIVDGIMEDYSAGHISSAEAATIIDELNRMLGGRNVRFYPGVSYRHLMTFRGEVNLKTRPPHDIMGQPVAQHIPAGQGADMIRTLIDRSQAILENHDVNTVRRDLGENPANSIWLWGEGKMPVLPEFQERFGRKGAAITAVDLVRGLARLLGWSRIDVQGATGYLDTNYAGKCAAAIEALKTHDLVFVHVEAPDEAGHNGDVRGKLQAIEQIDRHIVGPLLNHLKGCGDDWRMLVMPDHSTPCQLRTHTGEPVPFAMAGRGLHPKRTCKFDETSAGQSELHVAKGCDLMEFFLTVK